MTMKNFGRGADGKSHSIRSTHAQVGGAMSCGSQ